MALAPEQKLTYKEAGPAGVAAFEAGVAGQEARAVPRLRVTFRRRPARRRPAPRRSPPGVVRVAGSSPRSRSRCRTTRFVLLPPLRSLLRPFAHRRACLPPSAGLGPDAHAAAQIGAFARELASRPAPCGRALTRSSQIGEFYIMQPPQVKPPNSGKFTCDMLLYDEESDRHVRVTWLDALNASGAGEIVAAQRRDRLHGRHGLSPGGAGSLFSWWIAAVEWAAYSADHGPLHRAPMARSPRGGRRGRSTAADDQRSRPRG